MTESLYVVEVVAGGMTYAMGAAYVWQTYSTPATGAVATWLRSLLTVTWPVTLLAMMLDRGREEGK